MMTKCPDTEHNYLKFDDATVVCTKCADPCVVEVATLLVTSPQQIYPPCPGPHYPQYVPWWQPNMGYPTITYGHSTADPLPNGGVITK